MQVSSPSILPVLGNKKDQRLPEAGRLCCQGIWACYGMEREQTVTKSWKNSQ